MLNFLNTYNKTISYNYGKIAPPKSSPVGDDFTFVQDTTKAENSETAKHSTTETPFPDGKGWGKANYTQEDFYYPFGLRMNALSTSYSPPIGGAGGGFNAENKYLYNGKELNDEFDLGWYSYGKRFYSPEYCRFPSIDPISEKFPALTNYQYASYNPVVCIDIDGLEGYKTTTKDVQTGTVNVKIKIDSKVINESKSATNAQVKKWGGLIEKQMESTLKGSFTVKENSKTVKYSVSTDVRFNFNPESNKGEDFPLRFVDLVRFIDDAGRNRTDADGRAKEIGNPKKNNFQLLIPGKAWDSAYEPVNENEIGHNGTHEYAHGLGLRHREDKENTIPFDYDNL